MNKCNLKLNINYDLLDKFCEINNFINITDEMLKENNIYKELVYSTNNNFVGINIYPKDMPLIVNKELWCKIIKINNELKNKGLCLKILDAYRPIEVQKIFWESFYSINGYYDEALVANPNKYGTHNITINAIDLFIVKLDGSEVELPSKFDDFTGKGNIYYNECSMEAKNNRDLLIRLANENGLIVHKDEWWHFYDERLKNYGMGYNYINSTFLPKMEEDVFSIVKE